MKIWKIWGVNLPVLEIEAESFDDAIRKARKININYCSGQINVILLGGNQNEK